uniref:Uncharacterized protein n=1 Tax=Rhizophora mucronata TaxID=61149 RepID=A0A2P2PZX0_RHIMU
MRDDQAAKKRTRLYDQVRSNAVQSSPQFLTPSRPFKLSPLSSVQQRTMGAFNFH